MKIHLLLFVRLLPMLALFSTAVVAAEANASAMRVDKAQGGASAASATNIGKTSAMTHTLFSFADAAVATQWSATDDRVMGGISRSRMRFDPAGYAVFEGVMSLEQNGGFASVRADAAAPPLAKLTHYVVEVRGDGKRYKLNMRMSGRFNQVSYQATFQTVKDTWTTLAIPVNTFEPTFRGRRVLDAPPFNASLVNQAGLMISDGQDGPFQLAIRKLAVETR
jgi:NADH dehydrogenase [ubiquinone] 1 alpha subcomplex assembly factor 1